MNSIIYYDDAKIDETSQILLQILRDYGTPLSVRKLREEARLDQANQIHYRWREWLGRPENDAVSDDAAGLLERAGTTELNGQEMAEYRLTDDGRDFLGNHEDKVLDAVGAARAVETIRRLRARVNNLEARVEDAERTAEDVEKSLNATRSELSRVKTTADETAEAVAGKAGVGDLGKLYDEVEDLREDVRAIQEFNREIDDRLETLES